MTEAANLTNPQKLFPLILTDKIAETKAFYEDTAGFKVVWDSEMYLQVEAQEPGAPHLCFMKTDAFPDGKVRPAFAGEGVIVSVPTKSADEKYTELEQRGAKLLSKPQDMPWGWRSFAAVDPNGLVLDFFHVYKEGDATEASPSNSSTSDSSSSN